MILKIHYILIISYNLLNITVKNVNIWIYINSGKKLYEIQTWTKTKNKNKWKIILVIV